MTDVLRRSEQTQGGFQRLTEAKMSTSQGTPRLATNLRHGMDSPRKVSERTWPRLHLDFGLWPPEP